MRVTVIGPGAVGLLWASRLSRAGAEVTLLDHRPDRAAMLAGQGVFLEEDGEETHLPLAASADPAQALAGAELALVCVKAYHTDEVARTLGGHLPPQARALTLQNGAGNVEALVAALGAERVLGGITSEGATLLAPGRVRHAGAGQTHLGPAQGEVDGFTQQVAELFNRAGFATQTVAGVESLIWTKLVINVGINALTAILGVRNGELVKRPACLALMRDAVEEALAVGRALGVTFLHQDMQDAVRQVAQRTALNVSSMLADARAKRRTEVEFINGRVAELGAKSGIPTPVNRSLVNLVLALEQGYGGEVE